MISGGRNSSNKGHNGQEGRCEILSLRRRARYLWLVVGLCLFGLSACVPIPDEDPALAEAMIAEITEAIEEVNAFPPGIVSIEEGIEETGQQNEGSHESESAAETGTATLTVKRPTVNIRSGPSIDFEVLAKASEGDTFTTTGRTDEGWWRICCIDVADESEVERNQSAWISQIVVTPDKVAEALPAIVPLFPADLAASWDVQYECGSRRCAVNECAAVSRTVIHNNRDLRWLEINRIVTWEEACGEDSTWPHQIDRIEGTERYPNSTGLFFFNYWLGPRPGNANALFHLSNGEEVEVWCSDEQQAEVAEESGWTTVYHGLTCHDVRTGMLVSMQYTKRWFFTGEFEGDQYDRAYFGDFEVYKVKLDQTNASLAIINAGSGE